MTTVAVIPARYGSTRLPAKALARETGKYLVQHVYERIQQSRRIDRVIVATDDQRIMDAVASFGGQACMTRPDHRSGTDRVAEAATVIGLNDDDLALNVQGDEPEVSPDALDHLVAQMREAQARASIGTIAAPFPDDAPREGPDSPLDPNRVKVVVDVHGRALYFSRSPIPHLRETGGRVDRPSRWLLHLGVYAFRVATLRAVTQDRLGKSALEEAESLEQLRWLEHGYNITVVVVPHRFTGIDTAADYAAFVKRSLGSSGAVVKR
jgi:3-deoxy-manno-octulosonate cytidylyltransferase (CMP-KDO synthetase)